jgi:translation initiation factor 2B subunit (eIF-2B alpha/beta/delta family)
MNKKKEFDKICKDIKSIKIQGATNIAKSALYAYNLFPNKKSKKILQSLRPTEPMLTHVLELADKITKNQILKHFKNSQDSINKSVYDLIKHNQVIFTHCHSTNVIKALIYAKKHKKSFQVYNTETRPLFQGRKTAKELAKANIPVTMFIDSSINIALTRAQDKEEKTKPADLVLLGSDAIIKNGVINKVGSRLIAEVAYNNKIPVYIIADSWKRAHKKIKLEQRDFFEIWNPRTNKIHIKNPAFEFIPKKFISGIISEYGLLSFNEFLKKHRN